MITITVEVVCDGCRSVIASVGPVLAHYSYVRIKEARARAQTIGAKVDDLGNCYCSDCLKSLKPLMERVK